MTQNNKMEDLLYFQGKINNRHIDIKSQNKVQNDYKLSILISINI